MVNLSYGVGYVYLVWIVSHLEKSKQLGYEMLHCPRFGKRLQREHRIKLAVTCRSKSVWCIFKSMRVDCLLSAETRLASPLRQIGVT